MDAKELTIDQIDGVITDLGCRNAAGGIYTGSVYEFARAIYALAAAPSDDLRKAVVSLELTATWLDGGCDPARASTEIRAALDRIRPLLAAAQQGGTQS